MTTTQDVAIATDLVTLTIDGFEVQVPKGTLVIRAAELVGIQIPRFCDHPLLDPVGACRQCIVDVEGQRKPLTACTTTVTEGMVVKSQLTSAMAEKAQRGVLEMLLINHPLDCPVCDKGGECPLQNQTMSNGPGESRFRDVKRTYPKPIAISSQVLLDRERCVLCARCTRFSQQIAGDPFIEMFERGALQQIAIYSDQPFESYFSGNTVQICPVGALTGAAYRFRARPFDLVSTAMMCEHCASGCALRTDHRRGKVLRRLSGDDPQVNEEWNCDKGRWAFTYATQADRITTPLVREDGRLRPASWTEALAVAAEGLRGARTGVLPGGRLTVEDAYAYAKFARVALGTNDVDFRARAHSAEEQDFLAAAVAGTPVTVSYTELENAPAVLLAGLEPEDEAGILFLRLRKANRLRGQSLFGLAPFASPGLTRAGGTLVPTVPGAEPAVLDALRGALARSGSEPGADPGVALAAAALRAPGSVLLVGERLAAIPGALSAALRLARGAGLALAWVPRRAGDRGAVDVGALPALLPGGRPIADAEARVDVGAVWGQPVPTIPGRSMDAVLAAAADGRLSALVVGALDPADTTDPALALAALDRVPFLVSLELRHSAVTERADVVFPVAAVAEKEGSFTDWEGRARPFGASLTESLLLSDTRVLDRVAAAMDVPLGLPTVRSAAAELAELGGWDGARIPDPDVVAAVAAPESEPAGVRAAGSAVLASWHLLLDRGRMQDGDPNLAGTARTPVVRLSAATAAGIGALSGQPVTVASRTGSLTLPLAVTDMADDVVWVPANAPGARVTTDLTVAPGTVVTISAAGPGAPGGAE